ncbi:MULTISPECIES: malate/lactate/ureidoglycolate dehydrogenase [unclassified Polaromonas]|uniref:malate/lactate/ureidoglycolate dehydrogenase n=1 Tax=unclassified Polaromonas TaxID=2638319 RepID=UPI0018C9BDCE|nr:MULTISPECIES: malate/lactate/ureidoglycolate dehydrogenase [unclassified Polaromonas]MBG6071433.1 putative oxidoreductase [Polaromonas sp. CG_9.7]MBG6113433.1 putative oxidoreductase [Polaromonas sp. CG_9.2]MDH6183109.1 putative oxidoreductase [Polaromonas sp. CG_23.6]
MQKVIPAHTLRAQCASVLIAAGSSAAEAEKVAANLVMANLSGHDSHGVGMLPRYVDAVLEGGLVPNASVQTVLDAGALLSLNGQRGYGQVIGEQAMALGIASARLHGSCIMALAESHHLGRIGHFAEMAVAEGLVSLHFVNVKSRAVVAPWGGSDGRFGTNPCCIGIPLKDQPPFVLDFATSRVAQGKMRVAYNQGKTVAPGLLMDAHGQPTTDPGVVVVPQPNGFFGALMPFGEHKGYGLAIACELLGGALTGGGTWHSTNVHSRAILNSMLTVLIDPAKLGTQAAFDTEARAFVDWLRQSPPAEGFDTVQIAGEPERAMRLQREQDGIEIDLQTWQEIVLAAGKVGASI